MALLPVGVTTQTRLLGITMDMIGQLAERDRKWREQLNEPDRSRLTELDKKQESLLRNLRATISDKHAFDRAIDHADKMARKICGS